jgi:hypothetical protein
MYGDFPAKNTVYTVYMVLANPTYVLSVVEICECSCLTLYCAVHGCGVHARLLDIAACALLNFSVLLLLSLRVSALHC